VGEGLRDEIQHEIRMRAKATAQVGPDQRVTALIQRREVLRAAGNQQLLIARVSGHVLRYTRRTRVCDRLQPKTKDEARVSAGSGEVRQADDDG